MDSQLPPILYEQKRKKKKKKKKRRQMLSIIILANENREKKKHNYFLACRRCRIWTLCLELQRFDLIRYPMQAIKRCNMIDSFASSIHVIFV